MHETVIAAELARKVRDIAERAGASKVVSVTVRIGAFSGVVPDALKFAFELIRGAGILDGCRLETEEPPCDFLCPVCGKKFFAVPESGACPGCGARARMLDGSSELTLAKIEVED